MVRILPNETVRSVLDLPEVLDVVENAFEMQAAGKVERPERPHYPVGTGLREGDPETPMGTGLVMPAYLHGAPYFATKLVSVHEENPDRGLPTVNAQIVLNEAETGLPVAMMDGTHVTSARTGAVGGLAARHLTEGSIQVAVVGCGTQARWQVRAIDAATEVMSVAMFDIDTDALETAVSELDSELEVPVGAASDATEAVSTADLVVTATTSPEPVFSGSDLSETAVVVAIGAYTADMQEIDPETLGRASQVFADVPEEVAEIGDILGTNLEESDLIPYGQLLAGNVEPADGIVVVESVGSAVMDGATAEYVYERALERNLGSKVDW